MFGKDLIRFIKDNKLEDAQILEGYDDLPGYMSAKQFAKDMGVKECIVKDWIGWKLIPDAIHIGDVWFVPCDLIMVSQAAYDKLAAEQKQSEDTIVTDMDALLIV